MASTTPWEAAPGSRVGDYILEAELPARRGERIFASTHRLLPRRAHIVLPDPERAFELACVLESICHPAVPRIYECGQLDNKMWLAVSVIDGPTLAERLAHDTLAVTEVVAMIRDLAAILAHAHDLGIVHGDLRPERVASTANGWRIVDWSEAAQVKAPPGDGNSCHDDVEALGAVAYAALARSLPTMPLARRCPDVPAAVAAFVDRLIADAPSAERVSADAARLFEDLASVRSPTLEEDVDAVPISIEDIMVVEISRPPPLPDKLRVRPQGTGPLAVGSAATKEAT